MSLVGAVRVLGAIVLIPNHKHQFSSWLIFSYFAETLSSANLALSYYNTNFSVAVAEFQSFQGVVNDMAFRLARVKTNTLYVPVTLSCTLMRSTYHHDN